MFAWDYCLAWILISTFTATYKIAEFNMPTSCVAYGCTNKAKAGSGISFHRFPFSDPVDLKNGPRLYVERIGFQKVVVSFVVNILSHHVLLSVLENEVTDFTIMLCLQFFQSIQSIYNQNQ